VGAVTARESEEEEGTVVEQSPPAGTTARPGSAVDLIVSSGPATVSVPDIICQDIDSAQAEVESAGLDFVLAGSQFSDECEPGTVASQNPGPGAEVEPGTNVRARESLGPSPEPTLPTPTITP
jgi:beta-lactam-binding protein with PASTA domain